MTDVLPLSLVNDYLYCHRRAALKLVEGWREANVHTERGDIVHEHADLAGYEVAKGVLLWRALPVWSERLGLNGKCDIVEVRERASGEWRIANGEAPTQDLEPVADVGVAASGGPMPPRPRAAGRGPGKERSLLPVEFKLGKRRKWENDDVQLCAQALCLEEMFGLPVPCGAVFHADSKRRREVEFPPELRARTEEAIGALRALLAETDTAGRPGGTARLPAAVFKPACEECSLFEVCLPQVTADAARAARLARSVFKV